MMGEKAEENDDGDAIVARATMTRVTVLFISSSQLYKTLSSRLVSCERFVCSILRTDSYLVIRLKISQEISISISSER